MRSLAPSEAVALMRKIAPRAKFHARRRPLRQKGKFYRFEAQHPLRTHDAREAFEVKAI
jgi:hypothetical protein